MKKIIKKEKVYCEECGSYYHNYFNDFSQCQLSFTERNVTTIKESAICRRHTIEEVYEAYFIPEEQNKNNDCSLFTKKFKEKEEKNFFFKKVFKK